MATPAFANFTTLTVEESLTQLHVNPLIGLSEKEAAVRLKQWGGNQFAAEHTNIWQIAIRQLKSPFIYILISAATLAAALGEYLDAGFVIGFIIINTILGFTQEYRSEKSLQALKKLTRTYSKVLRGKNIQKIPSSQLVPGDILLIEPGDIIQADAKLIECHNFLINESILTGESQAITKHCNILNTLTTQPHKAENVLFSGTSVLSGQGKAVVIATGMHAYLGDISKLTAQTTRISSFEIGMHQFSTFVLRLIGITLALVICGNILVKGASVNIFELLLFSIALAASVIPEALPLVITFSLSRGAMALAKQHVIIKRLSAIEDLGGITVLCTDKTGTITQNKLEIAQLWGDAQKTLTYAFLASTPQTAHNQDPFDIAIDNAVKSKKIEIETYEQCSQLPFDPERKRNSFLVSYHNKNVLIVRGAPEILMDASTLSTEKKHELKEWITTQGTQGNRVLAVAYKILPQAQSHYTGKDEESDLEFVGCCSFTDPLKPSTTKAVSKALEMGIQIKILTGDSPEVAGSVGEQIGLITSAKQVILGEKLEKMTGKQLRTALSTYHVFARVSPSQKHWIIEHLKEFAQVGFLGEGINDAPALKAANVSLVVQGASDIAREAADIILTKSDLEIIIDGIQKGREVFANTVKYIKITLASNFGNFYAVAIASLIIDFLPMLPIQILLVNLLSDFPLIAVATDNVDAEELTRPQSYNIKEFALIATIMGLISTVFDFIFFALFYRQGAPVLQTNWFMASILTELAFIYSMRTRKNMLFATGASKTIIGLSAAAMVLAIAIPTFQIGSNIFQFIIPKTSHVIGIISMVVAYIIITEVTKFYYYRFADRT